MLKIWGQELNNKSLKPQFDPAQVLGSFSCPGGQER